MIRDWSAFIVANAVNVFIDTFFKFPFGFAYVLFRAFRASNDVYHITCVAGDVTNDIMCGLRDCASYCVSFLDELALVTGSTAFGLAGSSLYRVLDDFVSDKGFSDVRGCLKVLKGMSVMAFAMSCS